MAQSLRFSLKRKLACENSRFSVYFDEIAGQGQASSRDYLVVAPKHRTESLVTGVEVLPICDDKIGLIRVYRHAIQADSWKNSSRLYCFGFSFA